jgi:hypothetical protein
MGVCVHRIEFLHVKTTAQPILCMVCVCVYGWVGGCWVLTFHSSCSSSATSVIAVLQSGVLLTKKRRAFNHPMFCFDGFKVRVRVRGRVRVRVGVRVGLRARV